MERRKIDKEYIIKRIKELHFYSDREFLGQVDLIKSMIKSIKKSSFKLASTLRRLLYNELFCIGITNSLGYNVTGNRTASEVLFDIKNSIYRVSFNPKHPSKILK